MEKIMSKETNTQLKKHLEKQGEDLNNLRTQVSRLVDRLAVIEQDVDNFKGKVGQDLTKIVNYVKEGGQSEATRY